MACRGLLGRRLVARMSSAIVMSDNSPHQAPGNASKTGPSAPDHLAATRHNDAICLISHKYWCSSRLLAQSGRIKRFCHKDSQAFCESSSKTGIQSDQACPARTITGQHGCRPNSVGMERTRLEAALSPRHPARAYRAMGQMEPENKISRRTMRAIPVYHGFTDLAASSEESDSERFKIYFFGLLLLQYDLGIS